jgi:putative oxidoreductase
MTDKFVAASDHAGTGTSERPVSSRLADRLAAMVPVSPAVAVFGAPQPAPRGPASAIRPVAMEPLVPRPPQHAPAFDTVTATPTREPDERSTVARVIDRFVAVCSFIPYAVVALVLRFVMARVFFLDGQTRVDGPHLSYSFHGFDISVVLPVQVKAETLFTFLTQYAALPLPGETAAYLVGYAEFLLPLMLMLGFGTRIAALGLLIMTAMIQIFVLPEALWSTQIYWASLLLVLLSLGPGPISLDHVIRRLSQRF